MGSVAIALVGSWIPALINISGVRNLGGFQVVTVILKFVPLLFMATVGLFFIKARDFGSFNPSHLSMVGAISAAAAIALFSRAAPVPCCWSWRAGLRGNAAATRWWWGVSS